jgi:putative hydrolase of the HAD superfamily
VIPATTCVTFDLDDTLFLERDYARSGFDAVGAWAARELGLAGFAEAALDAFRSGAHGRIFDVALAACGHGPDAALIRQLVEVYRAHAPVISLLDDARACVEGLRRQVAVGVVSDGPLASQRAKADALGASGWADIVVLTEELGAGFGKPHRRAFELVERATGCAGPSCAYVADNPVKDFAGPRSLGWTTVRVRRPGGLHHDVPSGDDVDVELADLSELARHLPLRADRPPARTGGPRT